MPTVIEAAAAHRAALAADEAAAFARMLEAYGRVWGNVSVELGRITAALDAARAAGEDVSPLWLYRQDRLTNLRAAVEREVTRFAAGANRETLISQLAAVSAAGAHAAELTTVALASSAPGAVADFAEVSTAALDALIGHLADGSPLRRLFAGLPGDAGDRAQEALIRGVSRGLGPRAIATEVRHAMGGNLARAMTITRTETLRAYREASRLSFEANSDVVRAWRWTAARDLRTCGVCWAMDGTTFDTAEPMGTHPNCRCAMVPVTKTWRELGAPGSAERGGAPPTGPAAFARLSPSQQDAVLGKAKGAAYRDGRLALSDLVGVGESPAWGTTRHELSLADALG